MNRKTLLYLGLGAAAYFFLTTRQPVFQQQADGSFTPAGVLDKLTVMLTGAQPPQQKSTTVTIPGVASFTQTG
jgi:hypothetical protein